MAGMPTRKPAHTPRRRALRLLAGSPDGCTEAIMLAHGFSETLLDELVRNGLASARVDGVMAGKRLLDVVRLKITAAGWQALAQ
jgi:hypothetical protein